jgi:hypothetical protein
VLSRDAFVRAIGGQRRAERSAPAGLSDKARAYLDSPAGFADRAFYSVSYPIPLWVGPPARADEDPDPFWPDHRRAMLDREF